MNNDIAREAAEMAFRGEFEWSGEQSWGTLSLTPANLAMVCQHAITRATAASEEKCKSIHALAEAEISAFRAELAAAKEQSATDKATIERLERERSSAEQETFFANAEIGELRARIATLERELAAAKEETEHQRSINKDAVRLMQSAEMAALESSKENASLREDKRRLDWLEEHPFMAYRDRDPEDGKLCDHFTLVDEDKKPRRGITEPTLRAAIDAATSTQERNE